MSVRRVLRVAPILLALSSVVFAHGTRVLAQGAGDAGSDDAGAADAAAGDAGPDASAGDAGQAIDAGEQADASLGDAGTDDAGIDAGNVPPPPPPGPKTPGKPVTPVDNGCALSHTHGSTGWPAVGFVVLALWLGRRRAAQALGRS